MKRAKVAIAALGMLCIVPFFMKQLYSNNELQAAGTSFSLYEKVYIANNLYTVIGTDGSNVKLLMDGTTGTAQTWSNANSTAINFASTTNVGVLGNEILKNKYSLPLSTNLTAITTSNKLNAQVPSVGGDWWLGDGTSNNRNKFMTSDNRNNGTTTILKNEIIGGECKAANTTESGVKVTKAYTDEDTNDSIPTNTTELAISTTFNVGGTMTLYQGKSCTGSSFEQHAEKNETQKSKLYMEEGAFTEIKHDNILHSMLVPIYIYCNQVGAIKTDKDSTWTGAVPLDDCFDFPTPMKWSNTWQVNSFKLTKKLGQKL